jgi:hypothetical protein
MIPLDCDGVEVVVAEECVPGVVCFDGCAVGISLRLLADVLVPERDVSSLDAWRSWSSLRVFRWC